MLTEAEEDGAGAFVPVNNDDDDYSITDTNLGSDLGQNGAVNGEDDLLPITLRGSRVGKQYKLVVPAWLKVYKDAERAQAADLTFDMPAEGLRLWVEGRAVGTDSLSLQLLVGDAVIQGDRAKVTAFRWFGPLNVPEHAIYRYNATGTLPEGAKWIEPVGGTLWTSSLIGPSDVTIKWGAGPVVGKANFRVDGNYTWGLGVNVVEVKVEAPDVGDAFDAAAQGVEGTVGPTNDVVGPLKKVNSGDAANDPGLTWQAKVTLNGPDGDRGVAQMNVGFVQNATLTAYRATYAGIAQARMHGVQGETVFDADPDAAGRPWFRTVDAAVFFDPSAENKVKTIRSADTPFANVPVRGKKALSDDNLITRLDLMWDFNLFVVAATRDTRNSASQVHAKQASGQWQWDGSQNIGGKPEHKWDAALSKVTPPAVGWTEQDDGSEPKKDGTLGNTRLADLGEWNDNWNP